MTPSPSCRAAARSSGRCRCGPGRASRSRWPGRPRCRRRSMPGPTSSPGSAPWTRTWCSSRCTGATVRTGRSRSCWRCSACRTPGPAAAACIRSWDKVLTKHLLRDAGIPTPDFHAFARAAFRELGASPGAAGDRASSSTSRSSSSRPRRAPRSASSSPHAGDVPAAIVAAFSYDRRVLLERHVDGRDLAVVVRRFGVRRPRRFRSSRRSRSATTFYDFEARYAWARTRFVCPAELDAGVAERGAGPRRRGVPALGCRGFARVDLMLDRGTASAHVLEANAVPGLTETSLIPQAAEAAGIGFDHAGRPDRRPGAGDAPAADRRGAPGRSAAASRSRRRSPPA